MSEPTINEARERLRNLIGDEPVIPSIENLDSAVLPPVAFQQTVTRMERTLEGKLDSSARLDELTDKAFDNIEEILDMPFDGENKSATVKLAAAQAVLNVQVKVDETRLRKRQTDLLPKLLAVIERERLKLPKVIEHIAPGE